MGWIGTTRRPRECPALAIMVTMASAGANNAGNDSRTVGRERLNAGRGRPTLEKVARFAGVSRATVSRVVNGSPTVDADIRDRVLRAVRELDYVPNPAARSLVTQRTGSVALVVPEPSSRVFSDDQFFSTLIRGVSVELESADQQLVLMLASAPTSSARIQRFASGGHVDGVIFASVHGADPLPATLARYGIPVVTCGRQLGHHQIPYVDVDQVGGVVAAIQHLLAGGRRRIATIAGPQDMVAGIDRLAGYRDALRSTRRRSIIAFGDFTRESGAAAMRELLEDDPALDAVFVASDLMAEGALRTLRQAGRRVPEDVAVIGFDDVDMAKYTEPPLTTVSQPIEEMGRELVRLVMGLVHGLEVNPALVLPTTLRVRESA